MSWYLNAAVLKFLYTLTLFFEFSFLQTFFATLIPSPIIKISISLDFLDSKNRSLTNPPIT